MTRNPARIATSSADEILAYIERESLEPILILDTHPHADHLSAADYLKRRTGAKTGIGEKVVGVQGLWSAIYDLPRDLPPRWVAMGQIVRGRRALHHRLARRAGSLLAGPYARLRDLSSIGDAAFVHDTLLMPDFGTARCDFPGGDAAQLWRTIQRILALAPETRIFVGHDYMPGGREPAWESTVAGAAPLQRASSQGA